MPKLDLGILRTSDGVGLMVKRNGEGDDLLVPMSFDRAQSFLLDWWTTLSTHYPLVANPDPDATELPMIMVTGEFRHRSVAISNGLVRLMLQPYEMAGLGFELNPDEARALAKYLTEAADAVEAFQTPN